VGASQDIFHDRQCGKGIGPTGVERQMRDDLPGLLLRQPVIHRPVQVVCNLRDLARSNQRTDSDQAPIP
jgi:hypothetical protein